MNAALVPYLYQEELYNIPGKLIVVVNRKWESYSSEETALLTKILGSVKIDIAAVQLISEPLFSIELVAPYGPANVLIFGSQAEEIKSYENTRAQGFSVIKADDLSQLNDTHKKNLWLALKQMFGI